MMTFYVGEYVMMTFYVGEYVMITFYVGELRHDDILRR